jgi:glycosyltransferase involved in cell wall biosynthesis
LHPSVRWSVRLHSELPFLAQEGVALEWIREYRRRGVEVSANSARCVGDLTDALETFIGYTPNFYPLDDAKTRDDFKPLQDDLDIACFGAIRPMKNQLIQAVAALQVAKSRQKKLHFHVNAARQENNGAPILKNLRALFSGTPHVLVEHGWYEHKEFLGLLRSMDVGMQVSLTETFNIITADMVSVGLPVVVSDEIWWTTNRSHVDPTDVTDITDGISTALDEGRITAMLNLAALRRNSEMAEATWLAYL